MIKWITKYIGTSYYTESLENKAIVIIDVRDLVDKPGNSYELINEKINLSLQALHNENRIVICCDYGMSRSNAIAVGVLAKLNNLSFYEALNRVLAITGEEIKSDILLAVKKVIEKESYISSFKDENEKEKRILILGGSGFIGKSVIPCLGKSNKVFSPSRQELDLNKLPIYLNYYCEKYHITHILNLAYPRIFNSYAAFSESLSLWHHLLEFIKIEKKIHLIGFSGWVVFSGYKTSTIIADESLPTFPDGLYGESRYFCEKLIDYYWTKYKLKISLIRSSSVYGGGDKPKFLFNFIRKAIKGNNIITHHYVNGLPKLQLIHIDDICNFLLLFFKDPQEGVFHIGGDNFFSTFDMAQSIVKKLNSNSSIRIEKIETYTANVFLDFKKAKETFHWMPKISFMEGLEMMLKDIFKEKYAVI